MIQEIQWDGSPELAWRLMSEDSHNFKAPLHGQEAQSFDSCILCAYHVQSTEPASERLSPQGRRESRYAYTAITLGCV